MQAAAAASRLDANTARPTAASVMAIKIATACDDPMARRQ